MREQILEELNVLFRKVFSDPGLAVHAGTSAPDVRGWNSLSHMLLIREVERFYGIAFSYSEVRSLRTVGDLAAVILAHLSC